MQILQLLINQRQLQEILQRVENASNWPEILMFYCNNIEIWNFVIVLSWFVKRL